MANTPKTNHQQYASALKTIVHFFDAFGFIEANKLLYKMVRAAFAQKELLNKKDVCSLLYIKDEMTALIQAAGIIARHKNGSAELKKLFLKRQPSDCTQSLDLVFHAAAYDGFFTCPPADEDIYHTCQWFFKLIKVCYKVTIAGKNETLQSKPGKPGNGSNPD